MNTMDIWAEKGHKVRFAFPDNGYDSDQKAAKERLAVGAQYTVDYTVVGGFRTTVVLQEVPGVGFNSVMFADEPEDVLTTNGLEPEDEYERRQRGQSNAALILVMLALLTMVAGGLYLAAWIGTTLAPLLPR